MAESVRSLPSDIQVLIEIRESDLRTHEGVRRFRELKARSLPSIAISGDLVFEGAIPPQETLIQAILDRYQDHLHVQ